MVITLILSIQYLRAIAAMMVVFFHILAKLESSSLHDNFFYVGAAGVDLFFVISGYIMVYITEKKETSPSYFILSRFERIYPIYLLFTLIALCIYIINPSLINSSGETSIVMSFFYIPLENKLMLVQVGWTLIYEMFFYVLFFISMIINYKNRITICILIIIAFNIIFYNSKNYQLNFLSNQIIIEFALGMLSYFIVKVIKNKYISLFFIFFGISFLIINNKYNVDRLVDYGIPMLSLFLGVVSIDVNKKNSNYNFKVLKLIGDSSYSIYLIHLFTIGVSLLILKNITFNIYFFILFSFLLSVCSGIIFHIIVEKRIINFFRKVNKKLNL